MCDIHAQCDSLSFSECVCWLIHLVLESLWLMKYCVLSPLTQEGGRGPHSAGCSGEWEGGGGGEGGGGDVKTQHYYFLALRFVNSR